MIASGGEKSGSVAQSRLDGGSRDCDGDRCGAFEHAVYQENLELNRKKAASFF